MTNPVNHYDVWELILSKVDVPTLVTCSAVCKLLYNVTHNSRKRVYCVLTNETRYNNEACQTYRI